MERPKTRLECKDGPRPCPWVSCRYHLYCEVSSRGKLLIFHPEVELENMQASCALDFCEEERTLDEVANVYGLTKERVRQIEERALCKLRRRTQALGFSFLDIPSPEGSIWEVFKDEAPGSYGVSDAKAPPMPEARFTWPKRRHSKRLWNDKA